MTLKEMKTKVLALIEELNSSSKLLTDDPDIAAKINHVMCQVMYELARIKKIGKYVELPVKKGQLLDFEEIGSAAGYNIFQVVSVQGVENQTKADGRIFKILENGIAEIDCFVYPTQITENTGDGYEFELDEDVLEIMPYGVAADLLKSDVSTEYGSVYATRYESMLQRLDPRSATGSIYIEGGW